MITGFSMPESLIPKYGGQYPRTQACGRFSRPRAHHQRLRSARLDLGRIEQMLGLELGLRPLRALVKCDPQKVSIVAPVAGTDIAVELLLAATQLHARILGHR